MVEQHKMNLRLSLGFVLVCVLWALVDSSRAAAATGKKSCDSLFVSANEQGQAIKSVKKESRKPEAATKASPASVGIFEPITSIYTGSQLYAVAMGGQGKKVGADDTVAGLYRRDQRSWKILIPGEIMLDKQGAPLLTQLSLSKTDLNNYVVTVVDGNIHLLTGHSDPSSPGTMMQFGTKENPLFEVGSMQKRFLPTNEKDARVSIFQSPNLTSKGSQLVLVSVKFTQPQPVGDGLTFAFEVLPAKDSVDIRLNGKPVVLDYDFHETADLGNLVTGTTEKVVFSKVLFEQFRESELSYFGSHIDSVRNLVTDFANKVLGAVSPQAFLQSSGERVAYNVTVGRVEKDVTFKKPIYVSQAGTIVFTQHYTLSRGKTELMIDADGQTLRLDGRVDLLPSGAPAIWSGNGPMNLLFSKDGRVNGLMRQPGIPTPILVDLGTFAELFPKFKNGIELPTDIDFVSHMPRGNEPIEKGFIVVTSKLSDGQEFTVAIRMTLLMGQSLQKEDAYQLLNFALSEQELNARLRNDSNAATEPLFDIVTPRAESVAAYQQAYDASRPHVNLLASSPQRTVFKFMQPSTTMKIAEGVTYAEFSETRGVENPSGIYVNLAPEKITGNESDKVVGQLVPRPNRTADEDHPEKRFIVARFETAAKRGHEPKEDDEYDEPKGSGHKFMLLGVDARRRAGVDGYQPVLLGPDANGKMKFTSLDGLVRGGWVNQPDFLKHAQFIQGRRTDRDFVYLILSFDMKATQGSFERTFIYRINTAKPDEKYSVSFIDKQSLEAKDIQDRVAFDEDGLPMVILTPDLSPDAHLFAVFDLKKGAKDFPNQTYGTGKKKFKFGEIKGNSSAGEDSYVDTKDSWASYAFDVKKKYPNLGRSKELAQFDSFVSLGRQLDAMSLPSNKPERMILVVPHSLRELVWDYILHKGFSAERNYSPGADPNQDANKFSHVNRRLKIDLIDPTRSSQEQYLANLQNWSRLKATRPDQRVFGLARVDEMFAVNTAMPARNDTAIEPFMLNYVEAGKGADINTVSTGNSLRLPSSFYLLAAEQGVQLREFRNLSNEPSASLLLLATPDEMKKLESQFGPEIENGLLERFKIQEIKDPDPESMASSLAEIFRNPDLQSLDFQFNAKEIKPRAVLDADQSFEVVIDYAISRFTFWLGQKKDSRFEAFMRFRSAFAQAVLSDREVRRTRIVNKAFVERVLTQVFDIPMNLSTLPADDPMVIAARQDFLLLWQDAGHSGLFDLKGKIRDTVLSQTKADAGKPVPSSIMLFGATGSGKTKVFLTLIKALKLKLYDFTNTQNNGDASAIIINVGQLRESGGSGREGDMDVNEALAHLDSLLSTPNGYRSWILFDDVHAAPDAVKAKILGWQRSLFEAQNGMYSISTSSSLRRPVRNINIFMTLNPTADQDQIARYAKDKSKPTTEEILLATLSSSTFKIEPSFLRRWGRIVNLDFMPAGAKGPELLKSIALASNSLMNTNSRLVLVDPTVVSRLVTDNEQVDARTFLSTATSALVEVASTENATGALVLVVPAMSRFPLKTSFNLSGLEASPSEKITNWVVQNTRTLSLDASLAGNLAFTKLIVDAFRTPIYESLTMALQEEPRLAGTPNDQRNLLAPILAAISDHLAGHSYVSLADLNVNASDFGMNTASEREVFRAALSKMTGTTVKPLYPKAFQEMESVTSTWQSIDGRFDSTAPTNSRKQVLADTVLQNRAILRSRMAEVMRVSDLDALPDPANWLVQLESDTQSNPKEVGRALGENLLRYLPKIFDSELIDNRIPDAPTLTIYAATRLYLHSIDRALTQMQWVRPSKFLLRSLELITEDQVLSQKPGVQSFLFTDPQRLIKPSIPDFTFQIIASSHALEEVPAETRDRQRAQFAEDVDRFISPTQPPSAVKPTAE